MDTSETLRRVELDITCPVCKVGSLTMLYKTILIPYIGQLLISTIICFTCKFKISDIWIVSNTGKYRKKYQTSITEDTINNLVCASAGARIMVPELGAEIDIRTFDGAHITTVEGILREILDAINMLMDTAENPAKAEKLKAILMSEIESPSGKLTLILEDPHGHSTIIPYEYWVQRTEMDRQAQINPKEIAKKMIEKWREIEKPPM